MPMTNSLRTTLLACLVVLGLQFLFPGTIHAATLLVVLEETDLPLAGPEEDGSGPDAEQDLAHTGVLAGRCRGWFAQETFISLQRTGTDYRRPGLLHVSGRQPSAP